MTDDSLIEVFWQARQEGVSSPPAWFGTLAVGQGLPSRQTPPTGQP